MTSKASKGVIGCVFKNKYYSMKLPNGISLNNETKLAAKESIKKTISEEFKALADCSDLTVQLAKIASLTSLYLDLDRGVDNDIPYILVNDKTGHILITKDEPDEVWVEALNLTVPVKSNKKAN